MAAEAKDLNRFWYKPHRSLQMLDALLSKVNSRGLANEIPAAVRKIQGSVPARVSDSLEFRLGMDEVTRVPLNGPLVLRRLGLRFAPYYVMDYEVNTWKQFQHCQKEVRIKGKGRLIVNGVDGNIVSECCRIRTRNREYRCR